MWAKTTEWFSNPKHKVEPRKGVSKSAVIRIYKEPHDVSKRGERLPVTRRGARGLLTSLMPDSWHGITSEWLEDWVVLDVWCQVDSMLSQV